MSSDESRSSLKDFAEVLKPLNADIIASWLTQIKLTIEAAHGETDKYLVDHMPRFLESACLELDAVSKGDTGLACFNESIENAKAHGTQRAGSRSYRSTDIVREFTILRECLSDAIATGRLFLHAEANQLSRLFETAVGASVTEFVIHTSAARHKDLSQLSSSSPQTSQPMTLLEAERHAAMAREDLKMIANSIQTAIVRFDRELRYVFVNQAFETWLSQSKTSILGKTVFEVLKPDEAKATEGFFKRAMNGEETEFETLLKKADGSEEYVVVTFAPAKNSLGHIDGAIVTLQSVEKLKRAQLEASLHREELANVFSQAPSPIALLTGPRHVFSLANPPYIELIGRNPIGKGLREVFTAQEAAGFLTLLDEVYRSGVPYIGNEIPFNRVSSDGKVDELLISIAYHPYRAANGEVVGILAFVYDVTEQVRARKIIETRESRLRSTFAHASVGFAVSDLNGLFIEANPRFSEITGYSEDELRLMKVAALIHPDDLERDIKLMDDLLSRRIGNFIIEKRFLKKNGAVAWVRSSVSLVPDESGTPLVARVAEDVTAAREAEGLRKESEERFGILADSMPQIVWTALPQGELDYFNQVWFDYSGTTLEQNRGAGWAKAVHADDVPLTLERWQASLKTGADYENEFRLRNANGEYRWHVARATAARGTDGKIKKWYGTNTDIHESKQVLEQLKGARRGVEAEKLKFETIFADSSTSMAVLKGETFIYEIANPSYLRLFNGRDLVGKPFLVALPELVGQPFPEHAKKVFETGIAYKEREAVAYLKRTDTSQVEERYFDQTYTRMLDADGKPYGVFIHAIEVTDRVMARRQIEETASRFKIAVEAANMGTWDLNPQTGVVDWSDRTRELFGVERTGKIPLEVATDRIHPDDRERVNNAIALATDPQGSGEYEIEYRVDHGNNEIRWVSVLGRSYFLDTPQGRINTRFSGTVLDVTDRIVASAAILDAKERAEMANAAKSSFLANMSHEIRTPLGAIMGFVSLIKDEGVNQQTLSEYVSIIERNSVQLMRIIDDILDLSKVEAGMMLIEHIDFSLIELLSDFASLMGFRARERGISFELKAQTELPDIINSDPTRLRQILANVVGNAIKFTDRGSVMLRARFEDETLTLEVEDTGRGISEAQAEQLFQPFSQADASTTRKYGGTGLGLVLTRHLSKALGGTFNLTKSELGHGSIFTATIKVVPSERTRLVKALGFASEPTRTIGVHGKLKDLKVLLVEDSPDNQALFSIYLTRAGADIDIASDGATGLKMAVEGNYDVVLMDVQMPIMDGITAVKKLRETGYTKPVIALTAHAMKEEKVRCLQAGYTGFLSKPIQRTELIEALTEYKPR